MNIKTQVRGLVATGLSQLLALAVVSVAVVATSAPAFAANAKKDWTMMVFINGHNNLDEYGPMNLNQMEQVGSNDHLNIVAQWASSGSDTKRLLVQKDSDTANVTSPIVEQLPPVDMGDKNNLLSFIKWTVDNYPADHYMVVVWNHGTGWHLTRGMHARDISYDDISGHQITTEELGSVMGQAAQYIGHKVDIYGSDACLMSMVEVMQEMNGSVETFVGSEETEPGDGWPYHLFLSQWEANPAATSQQVGAMLVDAYHQYYVAAGESDTTFSALDMNQLPAFVQAMGDLRANLLTMPNVKSLQDAAKKSIRFFYYDYVDVGDLMDNVRRQGLAGQATTQLDAVSAQLKKIVIANATTGKAAQGLAVWWPTSSYDFKEYKARYAGLKFSQASGWNLLLEKMF